MVQFLESIINNDGFKVLIIVITLDTIFGILRAIKEKDTNSTIGIDGIIRKVGMLICVFFLSLIDAVVDINLIGFVPETITEALHLGKVGIASLFMFLFIVFEILSILKNMILCKLPIPKKLQEYLEKIMTEFTGELNNKKVQVIETNEVHIEQPNNVEIKKEGE